ncbi:MAG: response regulator transcription factor [Variibacter sp.]|nr:response regulator transcription factor [Variibacter sp.]
MSPSASTNSSLVFVVDDEASVRETFSIVLSAQGFSVRTFSDGNAFLAAAAEETPACVLLDVRMPGRSGIDILKELNAQNYPAPIFIVSGSGDIPMAVQAIRNGALDFIEKPFNGRAVAEQVREAIASFARRKDGQSGQCFEFPGKDQLTMRECEVLAQIASGASNKEAGRVLGISPRTVEVHRARIMGKLGARNTADLVRIAMSQKRD